MPPFLSMLAKIKELADLEDGWDSYNSAPAPDKISIDNAYKVVRILEEMKFPSEKILPSIDGGIVFTFYKNKRYADIECFNSDIIAAIMSDHNSEDRIPAWEVADIRQTVERIKAFINENS